MRPKTVAQIELVPLTKYLLPPAYVVSVTTIHMGRPTPWRSPILIPIPNPPHYTAPLDMFKLVYLDLATQEPLHLKPVTKWTVGLGLKGFLVGIQFTFRFVFVPRKSEPTLTVLLTDSASTSTILPLHESLSHIEI